MNAIIDEIYSTQLVEDAEGNRHAAQPIAVTYEEGEALYRTVQAFGAGCRSLEMGMAFGISTLFMCQGHLDNGGGSHVAIDPHQTDWFHGVGRLNLERAGLSGFADVYEEPSYRVLPRLIDEGRQFDFVFIDGNHRFEHVFIDWFLADRLLRRGGRIMLHDSWMPAARKLLTFIMRNHADEYGFAGGSLRPHSSLFGGMVELVRSLWRNPLEPAVAAFFARKRFYNYFLLEKREHLTDTRYDQTWDHYQAF